MQSVSFNRVPPVIKGLLSALLPLSLASIANFLARDQICSQGQGSVARVGVIGNRDYLVQRGHAGGGSFAAQVQGSLDHRYLICGKVAAQALCLTVDADQSFELGPPENGLHGSQDYSW